MAKFIRAYPIDAEPPKPKAAQPPKPTIIAVDFDGTLCKNRWPKIGPANNPLIDLKVTGTTYAAGTADESKCRGIKGKGNFTFDGGSIKISATGAKSKAISVDGDYIYKSGSLNCLVDAANT